VAWQPLYDNAGFRFTRRCRIFSVSRFSKTRARHNDWLSVTMTIVSCAAAVSAIISAAASMAFTSSPYELANLDPFHWMVWEIV